jgi:hypothetical protein
LSSPRTVAARRGRKLSDIIGQRAVAKVAEAEEVQEAVNG